MSLSRRLVVGVKDVLVSDNGGSGPVGREEKKRERDPWSDQVVSQSFILALRVAASIPSILPTLPRYLESLFKTFPLLFSCFPCPSLMQPFPTWPREGAEPTNGWS